MVGYGTIHNRASSSSNSSRMDSTPLSMNSTRKGRSYFGFLRLFGNPISPEAAAVRIIRNLRYFGVYYILVLWVILFVSLVPRRRLSLVFLVVMTVLTSLYLLLLRAVPNSAVLHNIIDKRLVLALLAMVTVVELILTRAIIHLLVSLAIATPIILVHAVLRVSDDLFVNEEASAAGELVPLVSNEVRDVESQA